MIGSISPWLHWTAFSSDCDGYCCDEFSLVDTGSASFDGWEASFGEHQKLNGIGSGNSGSNAGDTHSRASRDSFTVIRILPSCRRGSTATRYGRNRTRVVYGFGSHPFDAGCRGFNRKPACCRLGCSSWTPIRGCQVAGIIYTCVRLLADLFGSSYLDCQLRGTMAGINAGAGAVHHPSQGILGERHCDGSRCHRRSYRQHGNGAMFKIMA